MQKHQVYFCGEDSYFLSQENEMHDVSTVYTYNVADSLTLVQACNSSNLLQGFELVNYIPELVLELLAIRL